MRGLVVFLCDEDVCRVRFSMVGRRHETADENAAAADLQRAIELAQELGWRVKPGPTTRRLETTCPRHREHAQSASRKETTRA